MEIPFKLAMHFILSVVKLNCIIYIKCKYPYQDKKIFIDLDLKDILYQ